MEDPSRHLGRQVVRSRREDGKADLVEIQAVCGPLAERVPRVPGASPQLPHLGS